MLDKANKHQASEEPLAKLWIVDQVRSDGRCVLETQTIENSWEPSKKMNDMVEKATSSLGYEFGMAAWAAIWSSQGKVQPTEISPLDYLEDLYRSRIENPISVRDAMVDLQKYARELSSPLRLSIIQQDKSKRKEDGKCEIVVSNYA